jgi:hypothetical protein
MRGLLSFLVATTAWAVPRLTIEGGLAAGTSSELRPLGYSPSLDVYLVERSDKRPSGNERSWNFYSRSLDLLGYATLTTDAGVSSEHVQWTGEGSAAQKGALAELTSEARQKLVAEPKTLDKVWSSWQKLRSVPCPVRAAKREGSVELLAKDLLVAAIDTPLAPADAQRGCSLATPGSLRCLAGPEGDVVVVVLFRQDCGVQQSLMALYNPRNLEYLRETQAGETALKKGDLATARRHLEASLKLEARHAPAHFLHACVAARSGVAFREGRSELEQILGSEEERQKWLPKIKTDPNLQNWRLDPEFARWLAQFPTRVPLGP